MKQLYAVGFVLIAAVIGITSCKKKEKDTSTKAETVHNVSYGTDSRQVMDLYFPENRSIDSTKVMVLIHGGGWTSGSKSDMGVLITRLQSELPNYAIANINYRLCSDNPYTNGFPTQEQDVKQAIEFIKTMAGQWKVSNNITLVGMSAGAHLSLLQAYKHNEDQSIKAVAAFFPPTQLAQGYDNFPLSKALIELVTGGTPNELPQVYHESSPINYVSTAIPTIVFHGTSDAVVPHEQSVWLADSLLSNGKVVEMVSYPGQGHGFVAAKYNESVQKTGVFFRTHNP